MPSPWPASAVRGIGRPASRAGCRGAACRRSRCRRSRIPWPGDHLRERQLLAPIPEAQVGDAVKSKLHRGSLSLRCHDAVRKTSRPALGHAPRITLPSPAGIPAGPGPGPTEVPPSAMAAESQVDRSPVLSAILPRWRASVTRARELEVRAGPGLGVVDGVEPFALVARRPGQGLGGLDERLPPRLREESPRARR